MNLIDEKHLRKLYVVLLVSYFVFFTFAALSTALLPALMANDWSKLTHQQQFQICLVVVGNWLNVVISMLLRTLIRMARGQPPIESGDTSHLRKSNA